MASLKRHKQRKLFILHVYSFSFFVSSKTRYYAEFLYIENGLLGIRFL